MPVNVTVSDATQVLACLRDAILAGYYLPQQVPVFAEQQAHRMVLSDQIAKMVFVLDLYLTDSTSARKITQESVFAFRLLLKDTEERFPLSDSESVILLRMPTVQDPETVKAIFPDHPANAKAYHRWQAIGGPASQPKEFGPPNEQGKEIPR